MSTAMMLPVTLPAVQHVGLNSLRRRRQRAMALYVGAYVLVWVAFGVVALGADRLLVDGLGLDDRVVLWHVLVIAAAWELTRFKRRALLGCHRTVPLPPLGRRADAACVRFALVQGRRCVISCWPLMLVMAVAGHASLVWMAPLTALILAEELTTAGRRLARPAAALLAVAAMVVALGV
jgi:predicted metal-binding membrane protein